jgi:hypothetical protein
MVFDMPERRQVATVRPTTEALLLRAAGRELLVEAELSELRARDLRTGAQRDPTDVEAKCVKSGR